MATIKAVEIPVQPEKSREYAARIAISDTAETLHNIIQIHQRNGGKSGEQPNHRISNQREYIISNRKACNQLNALNIQEILVPMRLKLDCLRG